MLVTTEAPAVGNWEVFFWGGGGGLGLLETSKACWGFWFGSTRPHER